jgi:hypothetical protein
MTTVKVECDCGQRYAFDVEPVHGRMPSPVACPLCGADGTPKANAILSRAAVAAPAAVLIAPAPVGIAAAPSPVFAAAALPVPAAPPPIPVRSGLSLASPAVAVAAPAAVPAAPPPIPRTPPGFPARPPAAKSARGKDGWNAPETLIHKIGSYTVSGPAILAAMIAGGIFGFQVDPMILGVVVAVLGVVGGILNIIGRGPVWAGALVGFVTGVGGFGATWWWIQEREGAHRIYKIELAIAFAIGCAPGIGLQFLLQKLLKRKAAQQLVGTS